MGKLNCGDESGGYYPGGVEVYPGPWEQFVERTVLYLFGGEDGGDLVAVDFVKSMKNRIVFRRDVDIVFQVRRLWVLYGF